MNLSAILRAFLRWRVSRRITPLASARARRADAIRRNRAHHRPVRDLYRAQLVDTTRQLRIEVRR